MFKLATMCSGIGSPEQAVKELGVEYENVFACEIDRFARQTYLANFKPGVMLKDMTKEEWINPELYADLVIAGIPCQSFSLAGKRKGENDPRGLLIYDFIRYVKKQRPKIFILENVKGLLSDAKGLTISKWRDLLGRSLNGSEWFMPNPESCGYNLHMRVLNAKNYGLPQNRDRVFIIGIRPDLPNSFRWPKPVKLKHRLIDLLEPEVDEKYYLSDKMVDCLLRRNENKTTGFNADCLDPNVSDIANAIKSNYYKMPGDVQYIQVGAIRGRNPDNPKSRKPGIDLEQTFEVNENPEIANVITSMQKDNLILVYQNKKDGFVEDNIAPAIRSSTGGGIRKKGKVIQLNQSKESGGVQPYQQNRIYDSEGISPAIDGKAGIYGVMVKEATKQGYAIAKNGDSISLKQPNSTTRRGRVGNQIANTVETITDCVVYESRIRRYTPLETMRLQGFPDTFIKPCSDTQTYKQAGNAIPVHMIKAIINNLLHLLK